jgi:hypothetical protein
MYQEMSRHWGSVVSSMHMRKDDSLELMGGPVEGQLDGTKSTTV